MRNSCIFIFFTIAFCSIWQNTLFAQGTNETFGQNAVQYKEFEWSYFDSENFRTLFYLGGQDIGKYALQYAEEVLPELETKLEWKLDKKAHILIYNDLSDLNQTNIGHGIELNNTGGVTQIIGNKIFIYFNGNHLDLEKQIRQGISKVLMNHILFGSNFQEVLQNAVLLNLPDWFTNGLVEYMGESWSTEKDNRLRDGILSGRYEKFNRLRGEEATFAGSAIWHYVEEKYGKSAVSNLLYLTRINRSIESGFLFVLGDRVKESLNQWYEYYLAEFSADMALRDSITSDNLIKKRKWGKRHHYQTRISQDGKYIAFTNNIQGKYRVYIQELETGKIKRVLKGGIKTTRLVTDYSNPLIDWSPDMKTLAVIYEKRDKLKLLLYDIEEQKKDTRAITKFQQVNSFKFMSDPRYLVLSAVKRGYSDIYTYYLPSTLTEQITDDYFDDLDPSFVDLDGKKGIIFRSNRVSDTLRKEETDTNRVGQSFDLYFYNTGDRTNILTRVTNSATSIESGVEQLDDKYFTFLSDENGIRNRYAGYFEDEYLKRDTVVFFRDSVVRNPKWDFFNSDATIDSVRLRPVYKTTTYTLPITNYGYSIKEQDHSSNGKILELIEKDGLDYLYLKDSPKEMTLVQKRELEPTPYKRYLNKIAEKERLRKQFEENKAFENADESDGFSTDSITPDQMFFQSEFNIFPELNVNKTISGSGYVEETASVFQQTKVLPYKVKFSTDYVLTQIDNSLIMTRYQKFAPGAPVFQNPAFSGTINLGVSDLFEDYRIFGGFRFPFNFQGSEYFIGYENLRKRLDKQIKYYRKVLPQTYTDVVPFTNEPINTDAGIPLEAKIKTNYVESRFTYPIDVLRSFRFFLAYRHDNYVYQKQEEFSANLENYKENWLFFRLEYVFDNTIGMGLNLRKGIRFKFFAEIHKEFQMKPQGIIDNVDFNLPSFDNSYLGVLGFDFRYYQPIHKEIIWANRVSLGTSYGTKKLVYYLGGVESWLIPSPEFDNENQVSTTQNYAFQTIVTNMRGFPQNVRNGNSYFVLNSEIRIPVFSYLIHSPIRSEFIRNFQIIGFTDIGSAWDGLNPYKDENQLFTNTVGDTPPIVTVNYFKNPVVFGYGIGFRTTLFGYFIRTDLGWGSDSGIRSKKPKLYISLNLDF